MSGCCSRRADDGLEEKSFYITEQSASGDSRLPAGSGMGELSRKVFRMANQRLNTGKFRKWIEGRVMKKGSLEAAMKLASFIEHPMERKCFDGWRRFVVLQKFAHEEASLLNSQIAAKKAANPESFMKESTSFKRKETFLGKKGKQGDGSFKRVKPARNSIGAQFGGWVRKSEVGRVNARVEETSDEEKFRLEMEDKYRAEEEAEAAAAASKAAAVAAAAAAEEEAINSFKWNAIDAAAQAAKADEDAAAEAAKLDEDADEPNVLIQLSQRASRAVLSFVGGGPEDDEAPTPPTATHETRISFAPIAEEGEQVQDQNVEERPQETAEEGSKEEKLHA